MTDTTQGRIRGVPEPLPVGEHVLWEGAPQARALARHLLFLRPLTAYFAVMITWWALANRAEVGSSTFWTTLALQLVLTGFVLGGVVMLSRWIARTTNYAITDRRVVFRLGIIFPLTINVPLRYVQSAQVRAFKDRTGQIAMQLPATERLAWIMLFPHTRPWRFKNPEPMFRALSDPTKVGEILREAVLAVPSVTEPAAARGPQHSARRETAVAMSA